MDSNKFNSEVTTLNKFFNTYCTGNKHQNVMKKEVTLDFKDTSFTYQIELCEACYKTISYSYQRLQECPHEVKPKCRTCPNPCYEKPKYKELSKIMKYSGMRLGLVKLTKRFKKLFSF